MDELVWMIVIPLGLAIYGIAMAVIGYLECWKECKNRDKWK